ncbi:MAG: hypothetical protein J3R72DRAFT_416894 [Linnemannia gamsii]|nr:MAG: hypothetical protein J3R72DRAFT_416894 [Linnemannia gamsii]
MPKKRNPYLSPQDILALLSSSSSSTSTSTSYSLNSPQKTSPPVYSSAHHGQHSHSPIFGGLLDTATSHSRISSMTQDTIHRKNGGSQETTDIDRFGRYRGYNVCGKHSSGGASAGSRSAMISWRQKKLIVRNAFRVRERLLKVDWYWSNVYAEITLEDLETTLLPMLSCFPDLQSLYLRHMSYAWISDQWHDNLAQATPSPITLFSHLLTNCPNLTNINFGNNVFNERVLYNFLKAIRLETLREIVLKIDSGFLDRIIPMLLERSSATVEVLCLFSNSLDRNVYIGNILANCPRLKTFVVKTSTNMNTFMRFQDLFCVEDLLCGGEWACLELETLSIGVLTLSEYDDGHAVAVQGGEDKKDGPPHHHYHYQEHSVKGTITHGHDDPELAVYIRKIHRVADLYRRLKLLPNLKTLDLSWKPSSSFKIPYDLGLMYSNNTLTIDNLYWMSLMWSTISGSVQEVVQGFSEREKDMFFEEKMQAMGIHARDLGDTMREDIYWRKRYLYSYGCGRPDEEWEIPQGGWGPQDEDGLFENLHGAYKSRSSKRREAAKKWKK